jgi:hypothetical protein
MTLQDIDEGATESSMSHSLTIGSDRERGSACYSQNPNDAVSEWPKTQGLEEGF